MLPAGIDLNATISEATMDDCWDIELFLRLDTTARTLGFYASKLTKKGKKYGRSFIQINNHGRGDSSYDIYDTILHELAHHIHRTAYPKDLEAHGAKWKWICRIIGANPKASAEVM